VEGFAGRCVGEGGEVIGYYRRGRLHEGGDDCFLFLATKVALEGVEGDRGDEAGDATIGVIWGVEVH